MTFSPAPKPSPREKSPRTKIAAVSERHDPAWWAEQSRRVHDMQRGICAACGKQQHRLDAAHIDPLGTTATRNDPDHPRNQLGNLIGLCRVPCHSEFDRQTKAWRRARGAELKARIECPPGAGAARTGGLR